MATLAVERTPTWGLWPNSEQELLLRAVLLRGTPAQIAFEQWAARIDFDRLDGGSNRILPLLAHNLTEQGIAQHSPLMGRLRGVQRQTWYKNQLLIAAAGQALARFGDAGIPTLVLKGIPLAISYYPSVGLRPMLDADLLFPANHVDRVLQVARSAGLTPQRAEVWPPRLLASQAFVHRDGWEFDLHTHVMHECRGPGCDDTFWSAAVPITVGGTTTLALSAEDQLLHVLTHAAWRNALPPLRWVTDATMILRRRGDEFDWSRLVAHARQRRMSFIVARTLRYLHERMGAGLPADALAAIERPRVGSVERFEYRARQMEGSAGVAAVRVADYLRARDCDRQWQGPLGFARYVRDSWNLPSAWDVPKVACGKALHRLSVRLQGATPAAARTMDRHPHS